MIDLVFITTYRNENNINCLVDNIKNSNNSINVLFVIINQTETDKIISESSDRTKFVVINHGKLVSLSLARNIGIRYLNESKILFNFIMFPDDDSTFDQDFFLNFSIVVVAKKCYLINVLCSDSKEFYRRSKFDEGEVIGSRYFGAAISVNMIIDYETYIKTGFFDERLGLGTEFGAGEDGDYFIRCCSFTEFYFTYKLNNYHPSALSKYHNMSMAEVINKFRNYGKGVIFMLVKHKKYSDAFLISVKSVAGCIKSLLNLDFKMAIAYFIAFFYRLGFLVEFSIARIK